MTLVLILLAIPGVLAVLLRLGASLFKATKYSIERYVARQIVDQRAGRGDLTGMTEAENVRAAAARNQQRFVIETLMWIALLGLPLMFPAAVLLYPFYSIFWLLPKRGHGTASS
jgi:hypothetical protein